MRHDLRLSKRQLAKLPSKPLYVVQDFYTVLCNLLHSLPETDVVFIIFVVLKLEVVCLELLGADFYDGCLDPGKGGGSLEQAIANKTLLAKGKGCKLLPEAALLSIDHVL